VELIKDCLRIFEKDLAEKTDALILDNYVPKDGTYLIIRMENEDLIAQEPVEIRFDKKKGELVGETNTYYKYLQQLDYYSKLVEMNKPIDPQKIIHSNNYLSFFIKKESLNSKKVTMEIIDKYYEILQNPIMKYEKKAKSKELYNIVEAEIGAPDALLLQKIQVWVKSNLSELDVDISQKDYLKLFFVFPKRAETIEFYQREGRRYLLPNIYNNNEFNIISGEQVYGLPNDNMGMNAKKPYLEHKSRKVKEPYLLSLDEVLVQGKFFDYLMGKASIGLIHVYADTKWDRILFCKPTEFAEDFKEGIFLRIQKGKELEIHSCDVIINYNYNLKRTFILKEIFNIPEKVISKFEPGYGSKYNLRDMQIMIDDVFFGKWLSNNYFTDPGDISIKDGIVKFNLLKSRERLFSWFYKGNTEGVDSLLQHVSLELIKNSIVNGNSIKAKHQLNLRWSLMDYFAENNEMEVRMTQVKETLRKHINCKDDWEFDDSDEYYYAVGQLVAFYLSKTKGGRKLLSFVNPFLNAKKDDIIKRRLNYLFKKVNYDLETKDFRAKKLISHVMAYQPDDRVNQDILISGFTDDLLIYEKKEEGK